MTDERQARIDAIKSDLARPWQEVERAVETARWLLAELDAATARAERAEADRAERLIDGILSDLCDMEQDDPDDDDAIVVLYEPLKNVLTTWIRHGGVVPPLAALAEGA